jgi:cytochrome c oxidase assembly protein subunit 11
MDGRRRTLLLSVGLMAGMLGLVAASVPLYRLFCQVTGYAGTPRIVSGNSAEASSGQVTVRFDTNVMPDMPWRFKAEQTSMTVQLGETNLALFAAENTSKEPIVGTAVFNVTPLKAARFVDKIQCFCFTQQRLEPGQKAEMPVSFFIDPAILKDKDTFDVKTLTLSYTFYRSHDQTAVLPEGSNGGAGAAAKEVKKGKS